MVEEIMCIPICGREKSDMLMWKGKLVQEVRTREFYQSSIADRVHQAHMTNLDWLWKLWTSPRVKTWLWRLWHRGVTTKSFLFKRGLTTTLRCPRCRMYAEDEFHMLLDCYSSREVWKEVWKRIGVMDSPRNITQWWEKLKQIASKDRVGASIVAYTSWLIWKMRNKVIFEGQRDSSKGVVESAWLAAVEFCQQVELRKKGEEKKGSRERWVKPRQGFLKLNVDGAFREEAGVAAVGCVLRDCQGNICWVGGRRVITNSAFETELMAAAVGLEIVSRNNVASKLVLEMDCKEVVESLKGADGSAGPLVERVKDLLRSFTEHEVEHVMRSANRAAHVTAARVLDLENDICMWEDFPAVVIETCNQDVGIG